MIDFVVCDNNDSFRRKMNNLIESVMMSNDYEYKIKDFSIYDDHFHNYVKTSNDFKVYFLDIKVNNTSGLDAARYIREVACDWNSVIIIITGNVQYRQDALCSRLYLLDFVNKADNCRNIIIDLINISLNIYEHRNKLLKFSYNHIEKRIEYNDIMYIEKKLDSKKCKIKTTYSVEYMNSTINDLALKLKSDSRFKKSSRSMIVNEDHVKFIDYNNSIIIFDNGENSVHLSRDYKKGFKKYDD